MVQKRRDRAEGRRRGRPRAYDPDVALARAIEAFWKAGYSGTSLDQLSEATGMNRPSLYAAFGDKHDLYLRALAHYWDRSRKAMRETLSRDPSLRESLLRLYRTALSFYLPENEKPRGCFAIGTATTEALAHPRIRKALIDGLRSLDDAFEARLHVARKQGELGRDADPKALAMVASAALHTLAIRSRAGAPRAALEAIARAAVEVICSKPRV